VDSQSGTITRSFDGLDQLMDETSPQGQVSYTCYPNGLRQTMKVPSQAIVSYQYDDADRITEISQGNITVGFGYDSANRRTGLTLPIGVTVGYVYDNASQLTGMTYQRGSTVLSALNYTYDANGRRMVSAGLRQPRIFPMPCHRRPMTRSTV
jgi:YD repeat-containing protein